MTYKMLSRGIPLVMVAACSGLTNVQAPDVVGVDQLSSANGAKIMANAAISTLASMVAENGLYGVLTDESIFGFTSAEDQRAFSVVLSANTNQGSGIGGHKSYYTQQARGQGLAAPSQRQQYAHRSNGP